MEDPRKKAPKEAARTQKVPPGRPGRPSGGDFASGGSEKDRGRGELEDFLGREGREGREERAELPLNEVGLEKLFLFPDKIKALLDQDNIPDSSYPISAELSLTNRCDLNCVYCSDAGIRKAPDRLDKKILEKLFRDLSQNGSKGIVIEGGGEPLLSPLFNYAAELADKFGLKIGLITNGVKLFSPKISKELLSSFEWIRVSLDASSRKDFLALKGEDAFLKVLNNILTLSSLSPRPVVGVGYILSSGNDDPNALSSLAERLRDAGADYLHLRPVVDHPGLTSQRDLRPILEPKSSPSFKVNLDPVLENKNPGNLSLPCLAHSLTTVIGADGLVWLCGRLNSLPSWKAMGDLTQNSFQEIWSGPLRKEQAEEVRDPAFCRDNCPQCRITKFNKLLYGLSKIRSRNFI